MGGQEKRAHSRSLHSLAWKRKPKRERARARAQEPQEQKKRKRRLQSQEQGQEQGQRQRQGQRQSQGRKQPLSGAETHRPASALPVLTAVAPLMPSVLVLVLAPDLAWSVLACARVLPPVFVLLLALALALTLNFSLAILVPLLLQATPSSAFWPLSRAWLALALLWRSLASLGAEGLRACALKTRARSKQSGERASACVLRQRWSRCLWCGG